MTTSTEVLTAVRQHLIGLGLVRSPNVAGSAPPMHVEPVDGAPGPGERSAPEDHPTLVLTLTSPGEMSEQPFDTYRRRVQVDVRFRSKGTGGLIAGRTLAALIDNVLVNRPDYGYGYTLAPSTPDALFVLQATIWAGLGRIGSSSSAGFDERAAYAIEVTR